MKTHENKHTPGPWVVSRLDKQRVHDASGRGVANVANRGGGEYATQWEVEEEDANARLIAAAPELLEALQKAEFVLSRDEGMGARMALKYARSAIARATGA